MQFANMHENDQKHKNDHSSVEMPVLVVFGHLSSVAYNLSSVGRRNQSSQLSLVNRTSQSVVAVVIIVLDVFVMLLNIETLQNSANPMQFVNMHEKNPKLKNEHFHEKQSKSTNPRWKCRKSSSSSVNCYQSPVVGSVVEVARRYSVVAISVVAISVVAIRRQIANKKTDGKSLTKRQTANR